MDELGSERIIEEKFKQLFVRERPMSWDTEANNTLRAVNYGISENTTSITLQDVSFTGLNARGLYCMGTHATLTVSLYHGEKKCDTLNCSLQSASEFSLLFSIKSDNQEIERTYSLQNLVYMQRFMASDMIYVIDSKDKTNSLLLSIANVDVRQYLNVFVYILTVKNIFNENEKDLSTYAKNVNDYYVTGRNDQALFAQNDQNSENVYGSRYPEVQSFRNMMGLNSCSRLKDIMDQRPIPRGLKDISLYIDYITDYMSTEDIIGDDLGKYGELLTEVELKKGRMLGYEGKILRNLYVPKENGETSEIDLLYICKKGIVVIESKNYSGWIFGNEDDDQWTAVLKGGERNHFYNPVKQNQSHMVWLRNYLGYELPLFSVVAFSERCTLKRITTHSKRLFIANRDVLCDDVLDDIWEFPDALSVVEVERIYNKLLPLTDADEKTKKAHIENIIRRNDYGAF